VSFRRTLIFLIIFAALACFFYFYEIRGGEARKEAEKSATLIFSFKPEEVKKLSLQRPDGHIVAMKTDAGWQITEPLQASAEERVIDDVLKALAELTYERDLGAQSDPAAFGLNEPEIEVELADSRNAIGKLLIGKGTPDGANVYVKRLTDEPVFTIARSAKDKLDRTLFDLRDKTIFDFSVPDVKAVTIVRDGETYTLENKPEGEWTMTSPMEHDADAAKVTTLLDAIRYGRVKKFVDEDASDLSQYGLADPAARVELVLADGTRSLSLGRKTGPESENVYASKDERRQVVELDTEILDKLPADIDDWRNRQLVKINRNKIVGIEVVSPAGQIILERPTGESEEWTLGEPEQGVADEEKMNRLLSDLHSARVARFLKADESKTAARAFDTPTVQLTIREQEAEAPLTLSLSKLEGKPDGYARLGDKGEIFAVEEGLLTKLTMKPDAMRDRSVLRFDAEEIEKIEVGTREKSFVLTRDGVQWKVPRGLNMEPYEIDQFLWNLKELDYETTEPKAEDDASYGFDSPTMTVKLWRSEQESPLQLIIGKRIPEKSEYYAVGADDKKVMRMNDALISDWLQRF